MKALILALLVSIPAFAQTKTPDPATERLAQAMFDNAEELQKLKTTCNSGVVYLGTDSVKTDADERNGAPAVWKHALELRRQFRGQPGKDCKVEITQDIRPTFSDGPIAYTITVTELN